MAQPETNTAPMAQQEPERKTRGEKWFGRIRFFAAETFILIATAVIAYWARYGTSNPFKWLQGHTERGAEKLFGTEGRMGRIGGALGITMVTFHGGNLFAPFMKWFGDVKSSIVDRINAGVSPEEVEQGRRNMAREPKETWGHVIWGRLGAFASVFGGFMAIDQIAGRNNKGDWRFDVAEHKGGKFFAQSIAGMRDGKEGWNRVKALEMGNDSLKEMKSYRFGKMLTLDVVATTLAIAIWMTISKRLAKKHKAKPLMLDDTVSRLAASTGPAPAYDVAVETTRGAVSLPDEANNTGKKAPRAYASRETAPAENYLAEEQRRYQQRGEAALTGAGV